MTEMSSFSGLCCWLFVNGSLGRVIRNSAKLRALATLPRPLTAPTRTKPAINNIAKTPRYTINNVVEINMLFYFFKLSALQKLGIQFVNQNVMKRVNQGRVIGFHGRLNGIGYAF